MQMLLNHHWQGNIRELRNVVERMVIFADNEEIIIDDLPNEFEIRNEKRNDRSPSRSSSGSETLSEQLEYFERAIILREHKK